MAIKKKKLKLDDFDYHLPKDLIAQEPVSPRDHSRLLTLDRKSGKTEDQKFYEIAEKLKAGDVLVLNDSKVFPARLIGQKEETGGKIEVFLLKKLKANVWQCLMGGRGRKEALEIGFGRKLKAKVEKRNGDGTWDVKFNLSGERLMAEIFVVGRPPLPPYIKREKKTVKDVKNYQTVFANDRKIGSVAAPTAGLHFTPKLLKELQKKGVEIVYVTLHVGLGTFAPVKEDDIAKHQMHEEWMEVSSKTLRAINKAKAESRRVIAVGTTSVRTLESAYSFFPKQAKASAKILAPTDIFIYPGYEFKIVDAMVTNFHLPKSTLLMLVSAFAGSENIMKAYELAVGKKYRFYSYGDAMFIF